mgnify:CR=1 FL=1
MDSIKDGIKKDKKETVKDTDKTKRNGEIDAALRKVAFGFSLEEVTEEYGVEDGELKLVKRRKTRKDVAPDLKAVKMLLDGGADLSAMSDDELEREKQRLLKLLKENDT